MPDTEVVKWIQEKYKAIASDLDERARRRWAGAIRRWYKKLGSKRYPNAKRLLVTADYGGSNSPRT